jgi:hypothetical protein
VIRGTIDKLIINFVLFKCLFSSSNRTGILIPTKPPILIGDIFIPLGLDAGLLIGLLLGLLFIKSSML